MSDRFGNHIVGFPARWLKCCIVFQIGTYTISISAKAMNKPFYVVAESFKFARFYPLNQQDVPNEFKVVFSER